MSNWMRGLRRSGLIAIAWCGALALSSLAAYAQNFAITNLTNNSPGTNASYPTMLVDAEGNTYLAWVDPTKGGIVIAAKFDGTKFNTQTIAQTTALPAFQPQIAVYLNSGPIA